MLLFIMKRSEIHLLKFTATQCGWGRGQEISCLRKYFKSFAQESSIKNNLPVFEDLIKIVYLESSRKLKDYLESSRKLKLEIDNF